MDTRKSLLTIFALTLITFFGTTACDDTGTGGNATGTMTVSLTDAPADYDEVNITIDSVLVKAEKDGTGTDEGEGTGSDDSDSEEDEWVTIMDESITVNLLDLQNGNQLTLGETVVETGRYEQIRFVLGTENEVVIDGESFPLNTPSGQQSGLKLNINADVEGGENYDLLVDFDAGQSIVVTGNGSYILKPVIRIIEDENTGSITGIIEPTGFQSYVMAVQGEDTLSTYSDEEDGAFSILGLDEGTYEVTVQPSDSQYADSTITGVEVIEDEETDLGTIELESSSN